MDRHDRRTPQRPARTHPGIPAAAVAQFRGHERPDTLLSELRRIVDAALRDLVKLCPLPAGATLAAVGGYGRGELYPHSDVDLLILLPNAPRARTRRPSRNWWHRSGPGVGTGHSVRTIEDCEREADADITVETALLESRWLAGSRTLMKAFEAATRSRLDPRAFFRAKRVEMQQRHARYHDTPYALEPNCKRNRPVGCATCRSSCGWPARRALAIVGGPWPRPGC